MECSQDTRRCAAEGPIGRGKEETMFGTKVKLVEHPTCGAETIYWPKNQGGIILWGKLRNFH